MDQSFAVQLPVFCFEKYSRTDEKLLETGCDLSFVGTYIGLYSHTYLFHFQSLDHQKQLRVGWDMTKTTVVQVFCHSRTTLIVMLITWAIIFFVQLYYIINTTILDLIICTIWFHSFNSLHELQLQPTNYNYKLQPKFMSFWFGAYLGQMLTKLLESWINRW